MSNLRVEDRGLPMHIAALIILDGAPLLDESGQLRMDAVQRSVQRRLHLAPRLRQVLLAQRPGLGLPAWVDAAGFDIREHIRARAVPPPGDEAALLGLCAELNEPSLDRTRPLWEMWLLTGLSDGNVGMLIRLHHVVADGIAALAMIGALFGASPDEPPPAATPWVPEPPPGWWQLLTGNIRQRAWAAAGALLVLLYPGGLASRLVTVLRQGRQLTREGRAPQVSVNRPVGDRRRVLLVRGDLRRAHAVAHAHGGKINDVVLAAVAGGARRLLEARGELRPGLVLKASVAVSVRDGAGEQLTGNRVGVMIAPLPVTEADPVRRLEAIARATAERKRQPPYQPGGRFLQRWMVRTMSGQHIVNLLVSNLAGPATPLYFEGARALEVFQIGVVQGNVTISVGVLSYAGRLNFDIVGDADATPDLPAFADGLTGTLQELGLGP
jgi:diacylglycerol O-acyltransferase / wax synthase